jgi:hypothetical protein
MHDNFLTFSRGGVGRDAAGNVMRFAPRRYRVSPLLFPQYGVLNGYYLPKKNELPGRGLIAQVLVFDFGFAIPSNSIGAYDTQYFPINLGGDFLALGITGASDIPPSQNVTTPAPGALSGLQVDPAYLVSFQQTHEGSTWQWTNKAVTNREAVGKDGTPRMLVRPALIPAGDTLGCTVQNLANTTLRVQVAIIGAVIGGEPTP